ncbi:hypothetical protein, conserved [Eimeria brunetti]|uniref:Uncharacterized protein n=1 Tax=Eimeria brunetti TaxID=51314 RepID=U6LLN4_9EIME|nr:hypothetical protein, conserved [Eimeria brunetti]
MRVMGDRPYPVSETYVTSYGRRVHPPARQKNEVQQPTQSELASRRLKELTTYMSEICMFRSNAIDAAAVEAAIKERTENKNASAHAEEEKCIQETESSAMYKFHAPDAQEGKLLTPEDSAEKYFQQGLCKDTETLGILEKSLRSKNEPHTASEAPQPALQSFKQRLREAIKQTKGCLAFLILRAVLKELSDARGLVPAESVEQFLWDAFGVQSAHIPIEHLRSALKILTLVDKASVRAADLVEFIWAPTESCRRNILVAFHKAATASRDIVAAGSTVATVRITHPRPMIQLSSIPEFLHPFLCEKDTCGQVALPLVLEALVDLSQGVDDDASFLATVCDIAEKEGFHL